MGRKGKGRTAETEIGAESSFSLRHAGREEIPKVIQGDARFQHSSPIASPRPSPPPPALPHPSPRLDVSFPLSIFYTPHLFPLLPSSFLLFFVQLSLLLSLFSFNSPPFPLLLVQLSLLPSPRSLLLSLPLYLPLSLPLVRLSFPLSLSPSSCPS